MNRQLYYIGILFVIALSMLSGACSTQSDNDIPAAITTEPSPSPTIEQVDFPTDEQFAEWDTNSLRTVFRKWLGGENIDGKFIELEWNEDALKYIGTSQREARVTLLDLGRWAQRTCHTNGMRDGWQLCVLTL